jgi:ferredoxin
VFGRREGSRQSHVLVDPIPNEHRQQVQDAAMNCPEQAILLGQEAVPDA